ncbi:hypothetical protein GCM10023238_31600 [Streptomyces heliomycini]
MRVNLAFSPDGAAGLSHPIASLRRSNSPGSKDRWSSTSRRRFETKTSLHPDGPTSPPSSASTRLLVHTATFLPAGLPPVPGPLGVGDPLPFALNPEAARRRPTLEREDAEARVARGP